MDIVPQATSDQEIVRRAIHQADDFALIIERYQQPIRRYIMRLGCRSQSDADDLLQDIFLKVYLHLNDYNPKLKFSSWVYRIGHNETINFFRKQKRHIQPVATEEDLELFEKVADPLNIPAALDTKLTAERVNQALTHLNGRYQDVLVLRYLEEKSYAEISDILKIPIGTAWTLVHRAKKQLHNFFLEHNLQP